MLDLEHGKHEGSIFVVKLPKNSAVMYCPEGLERTLVTPELFYRIKNKNKTLVSQVKAIIKGD
jgi:hypothetical protein